MYLEKNAYEHAVEKAMHHIYNREGKKKNGF